MVLKQFMLIFLVLLTVIEIYGSPTGSSRKSPTASQEEIIKGVQNEVASFTANLNKFFYQKTKKNENVLIAPINIYGALSLLHLGADGTTKSELSKVLGLPESTEKLLETHETLGNLFKSLQQSQHTEVSIGNGFFAQKGVQLKPSYVQQANNYYNNEVTVVDFAGVNGVATDTVNKWIANKTKDRIPKLFSEPISASTQLLIASALYFSASWENKFSDKLTKLDKFNTGSENIDVQTMHLTHSFPYANNPKLQIESVSIPYDRQEFSMFIVLPYENQTLSNLVNKLTSKDYQQIIEDTASSYSYIDLKIPRMKFKWQKSINEQLQKLGINELFGNANLKNMISSSLSVSDCTHAAEIEVHENGTVASAVTVLQFIRSSLYVPKAEPVKVHVNRPFLFFIYSFDSKVILFTGLVQKPNDN